MSEDGCITILRHKLDRLHAYELTGLTPEAVMQLKLARAGKTDTEKTHKSSELYIDFRRCRCYKN